ncbi:MAG: hypothetical protein IJK81_02880 [Selenomonadaceae bacterium]|nr:hypothetical protein [Selenomonadaceae bacterium]
MTAKETIKLLDKIYWERMIGAHHDPDELEQPDLEAIKAVMNLIKFLDDKNPSDKVKVAELLKVANIGK